MTGYQPLHPVGPVPASRALPAPIAAAFTFIILAILTASFYSISHPSHPAGARHRVVVEHVLDLQLPTL